MYRAAVRDGARIDWQCPRCQDEHSDPFGESTRVETKSEVNFVNEMLSLIKKGSFESRICISILDFHTTSPYLFQ